MIYNLESNFLMILGKAVTGIRVEIGWPSPQVKMHPSVTWNQVYTCWPFPRLIHLQNHFPGWQFPLTQKQTRRSDGVGPEGNRVAIHTVRRLGTLTGKWQHHNCEPGPPFAPLPLTTSHPTAQLLVSFLLYKHYPKVSYLLSLLSGSPTGI